MGKHSAKGSAKKLRTRLEDRRVADARELKELRALDAARREDDFGFCSLQVLIRMNRNCFQSARRTALRTVPVAPLATKETPLATTGAEALVAAFQLIRVTCALVMMMRLARATLGATALKHQPTSCSQKNGKRRTVGGVRSLAGVRRRIDAGGSPANAKRVPPAEILGDGNATRAKGIEDPRELGRDEGRVGDGDGSGLAVNRVGERDGLILRVTCRRKELLGLQGGT